MRSVKIALAVGLAVTAAAVGVVLSRPPLIVLASSAALSGDSGEVGGGFIKACQSGERLPRHTQAIRLALEAFTGPAVKVNVFSGTRVVAVGERGSGWSGADVTVPLKAVSNTRSPVTVCFALRMAATERLRVEGEELGVIDTYSGQDATAAASKVETLQGRVKVEYLGEGRSSWLALAGSVVRHMALGRAWSGEWVAFLVPALLLIATILASRLIVASSPDRRSIGTSASGHPRRALTAAALCALVACLNAVCWSFITPPFQVPDEPAHFAYVKQLAETGALPTSIQAEAYSREESAALAALHFSEIRQRPVHRAILSSEEQTDLERELHTLNRGPREGSPPAGVATSEPPLYYALESIPYVLASNGTLLDRLQLMRLLTALIAGFTALFTFLFLREALPRERWAWTMGALCAAFAPLVGFMSGAVNPDAMLYAVSAAVFYCLARAFHRGLSTRSAIATGIAIAIGFSTKLNFIGLAPGVFLALAVLAIRDWRRSGRKALLAPAVAAIVGCIPVIAFAADDDATWKIATTATASTSGSLLSEANYVWQLYLPRLPGAATDFPGLFTTRQIWFDGYVGRFGWLDTFFPNWVYTVALAIAGIMACLCVRALIANRTALRDRATELGVYALMSLGVFILVGASSYRGFPTSSAYWGQARYLLPMLPLLAAMLALAARGAGKRWGPATGAVIVVVFLAHDVFSQLQVVARYYG